MTPGHHRDWGLPGVWEHQGLPTSGQDLAARAHLIPSQELGCWETLGHPQPWTLGPPWGKEWAIVSPWMDWSSGPGLVMVTEGHTALGWTCECSQDPDCQCTHLMLCCQYMTGSKLVLFPISGSDQIWIRALHILYCIMSWANLVLAVGQEVIFQPFFQLHTGVPWMQPLYSSNIRPWNKGCVCSTKTFCYNWVDCIYNWDYSTWDSTSRNRNEKTSLW